MGQECEKSAEGQGDEVRKVANMVMMAVMMMMMMMIVDVVSRQSGRCVNIHDRVCSLCIARHRS